MRREKLDVAKIVCDIHSFGSLVYFHVVIRLATNDKDLRYLECTC